MEPRKKGKKILGKWGMEQTNRKLKVKLRVRIDANNTSDTVDIIDISKWYEWGAWFKLHVYIKCGWHIETIPRS